MEIAILGFACLLLISFIGVPLGLSALLVGFFGFMSIRGAGPAVAMSGQQILDVASHNTFAVIPLFVLMGIFIYRANISDELYAAGYAWLGHRRGGIAMSTVAACGAFSAVSGSSMATAATMARVAVPPLRKYGYRDSLSLGSIAAGGTLGIMIPPSVPMIVYAIVAEQDVGTMFMAGLVPGALLLFSFLIAIGVLCAFRPAYGPPGDRSTWRQRLVSLKGVWPVLGLMFVVLAGIYAGVFTATEAAGVGAGFSGLYAVIRGRMGTFRAWYECLSEAAMLTATLFIVIIGSLVFANFVNLSGLPYDIVNAVNNLSLGPIGLVIVIAGVCIVLGTVFETIGILVLVIPLFLPALSELSVDFIWFGVIVVVVIEMGLISPPMGMNVFTVKTVVPDASVYSIFKGAAIFLVADVVVLAIIIAFPSVALWVPSLLR